ncbi:hypothetical protein DRP43_05120 [candidate division TA06 bacterium]|uniref:IMP cyclohydrolase n=1 Tax=candidate division TA06 bacterium TaxID=2250710 RepID=A0A660SFJ0_UNCT6|nr:MAG: hypothetical protein DRP43_05120 [candidate division TA06 bacterium]
MLDFSREPAAVVVKHQNPCGLATGYDLKEAFKNAWFGDEVSAFGSVVGYSQKVGQDVVKLLTNKFVEVLVAPDYDESALTWIKSKKSKKNLRIIPTGNLENPPNFIEKYYIRGGIISQTQNNKICLGDKIEDILTKPKIITEPKTGTKYKIGCVTKKNFKDNMENLVKFAIIAGKYVKSNAIILAYEYETGKYRLLGIGAGQPNRKDSVEKLAIPKAKENLMRQYFREQSLDYVITMDRIIHDKEYGNKISKEIESYTKNILSSEKVVLFSDAFFPFRDGLVAAAQSGIRYIVQPGGSTMDESIINAANEYGLAMSFTGIRHFRH